MLWKVGSTDPAGFWTLMLSGKALRWVDSVNKFEQNLTHYFFLCDLYNYLERIFKDSTFIGVTPIMQLRDNHARQDKMAAPGQYGRMKSAGGYWR